MKKLVGILLLLFFIVIPSFAQESVKGVVVSHDKKGRIEPIPFANVYWMHTNYGTSTDSNGTFQLAIPEQPTKLIASFVGFIPDTQLIENFEEPILFELKKSI